jgi:AraC family transcriptional regulator
MTNGERARPEWAALQNVHRLADAQVTLVSPQKDWDSLAATRFRMGKVDVSLPALGVPAFGINYGPDMQLERTLFGRRISGVGRAGYLSLLPPDADTRWVFDKPGDIVLVFLNRQLFDDAIEQCSGRAAASVEIVPRFVIRDLVLERIAHQLLGEISEPRPDGRLRREEMAQELASHLLEEHSSLHMPEPDRPHTLAPNRMKRVEEFIAANLGTDLSLEDIASAAGMSLYHFAKAFKQASGHSPYRYVKEQRLRQARTLLHDGSLTISQVAEAVGFSHSYFSAEFRQHMGMTPSKFRDVLRA